MKKIDLKSGDIREISSDDVSLVQVNENNINLIQEFLINHVNGENIPLDKAFIVYDNEDKSKIMGLFSFANNDIRNEFTAGQHDKRKINCSELCYLILDEKILQNKEILYSLFQKLIPLLINDDFIYEVIWFKYKGNYHSAFTEKIYLKYPEFDYYYVNEADKLSSELYAVHHNEKERMKNINKLIFGNNE